MWPLFVTLLFLFSPKEQVGEPCEVFLHDDSKSLCVQTVAREVAVVCLVVYIDSKIAVREQQIFQVEVADEAGCGIRVVAVAELSVEEQSVVEHTSRQQSFVFGIVESFRTGGDVSPEVPVAAVYHVVQHTVYLLADGAAEEALHGKRCLAVLRRLARRAVVAALCHEPSHGEQIEYLLVFLLLGVEQRVYHLLHVVRHIWHVKVEVHFGSFRLAGDVHQAVHAHVVVGERLSDVQVGKAYTVEHVESLQVECSSIRIASERYCSAFLEEEVLLYDILYGELCIHRGLRYSCRRCRTPPC